MKFLAISVFVFASMMLGCSPKSSAIRKLDSIDSEALVAAAHSLNVLAMKESPNFQYDIPESEWPLLVRQLQPKIVRSTHYGTTLLFFKWVSKEQGLYIPPTGYDPTKHEQSENVEYEQIKPGIFWYSISG